MRYNWALLSLTLYIFSFCYANEVDDAEELFENAWHYPSYTQIQLDDSDINQIISDYYETEIPIKFTREMLWDLETKKAWDPKTYLSYVVREGKSWGRKILENGDELFVRSSQQKQWLNPEKYEEVLEQVYLNYRDQKITFIGTRSLSDELDQPIFIENKQPLFYVEHSVTGDDERPLNAWRIIFLTEFKDQELIDLFQKRNDPTRLPEYIENYILLDLQIKLSKTRCNLLFS